MSGKDKLNSKADPTITLIVGNSITRDVILLFATNCVLHETTTRHTTNSLGVYRDTQGEEKQNERRFSLVARSKAQGFWLITRVNAQLVNDDDVASRSLMIQVQ